MKLTKKQTIALDILEDEVTTEPYYGGAAGGGKSVLGGYWELKCSVKYPGSKWLMGRSELKTLKKTTLATFFEVCKMQGIKVDGHLKYNEQSSIIGLYNGSQIILADLYAYPSDPEFDSLGSLEITGAFVDEAPQITVKAKNILKSRIRYKLDCYCNKCGNQEKKQIIEIDSTGKSKKWVCGNGHITIGLIPKLLMTGNPSKGWAYYDFYLPSEQGKLRSDRKFIQALVTDNPNISSHYIESLRGLDKNSRERLLNGNWRYDDDPTALIDYDKIIDTFSNTHVNGNGIYITADIARYGSDNTVIGVWKGHRVRLYSFHGLSVTESANKIKEFKDKFSVVTSNIIADEDGVGGGVVDILKCKGFVNNSTALPGESPKINEKGNLINENFRNLKSQCYFKLADRINAGQLFIECEENLKQTIIEELEQVKQYNMDKDSRKEVMPKDKVKELIGRSPDFSDTLMMREWFELKPKWVNPVAQ